MNSGNSLCVLEIILYHCSVIHMSSTICLLEGVDH